VVFVNWVGNYIANNGGSRLIIRRFRREELPKKDEQTAKAD